MLKVLFIDRQEEDCAILQRYLRQKGIDLITETDPLRSVSSCLAHKPAVVMIEAHTGLDMDGIDILGRLRNDERTRPAKVIMLSGLVRADDYRAEAIRLGVDDFIIKPVDPVELFERIQSFDRVTQS